MKSNYCFGLFRNLKIVKNGVKKMRTGENIRKRKDNRWEARYFDKNKNGYVSVYAHSYTEVKQKRNERIESINSNIVKNTKIDFAFCCEIWLKSKHDVVKQSTYCKYYDTVYKHLIPYFRKTKMIRINQDKINNFISFKISSALSVKTVKDIINVLKQILKSNQLYFEYKMPHSEKTEVNILQQSELQKLISYLLLTSNLENLGVLLSLATGLRIGELCALKWADIDIENAIITVKHTLQRIKNFDSNINSKTIVVIDTPKSLKSIRQIPIQNFLLEKLKFYKKSDDCFVLTGTRKYIEPRTQDRHFKKILQICNIDSTKYHVIRHTFASKCIENNMDAKTLSEILGHADVKFTMSQYVHTNLNLKRREMEKLIFSL